MDITTIEKGKKLLDQLNQARQAVEKEHEGIKALETLPADFKATFRIEFHVTNGKASSYNVSRNTALEALRLSRRETEQCIERIEKQIAAL